MKKTWTGLSVKTIKNYNILERVCDPSSNQKAYRSLLSKGKPPLIPFVPLVLKDVTFINDGYPNKIGGKLINFEKCRMIGDCLRNFRRSSEVNYDFEDNPVLQNYIRIRYAETNRNKLKEESLKCEN